MNALHPLPGTVLPELSQNLDFAYNELQRAKSLLVKAQHYERAEKLRAIQREIERLMKCIADADTDN